MLHNGIAVGDMALSLENVRAPYSLLRVIARIIWV